MNQAERRKARNNATHQGDQNDRRGISFGDAAHSCVRAIELARLFQTHQSADDWGRAGFGMGIDQENSPLRSQADGISTARLQGGFGLGKIVELPRTTDAAVRFM